MAALGKRPFQLTRLETKMQWDILKLTERARSVITRGHITRRTSGSRYEKIHGQDWFNTDVHDVPHMRQAGFCSNAGTGSGIEYIMLDPNSDPSHRVCILATDEARVECEEGETCVYSPKNPDVKIKLTQQGVCIETPAGELIQTLIDAITAHDAILGGIAAPQIAILTAMKCEL